MEVELRKKSAVRKKIRLEDYNYSNVGMYFITICTKNRYPILGKINECDIELTKDGVISKKNLKNIEYVFNNISINEYIIMPNHIHMIIEIKEEQEEVSINKIIKKFKSSVSRELGYSIWQKSYYDHIIRNEKEFYDIKQYIQNNVINWKNDKYL